MESATGIKGLACSQEDFFRACAGKDTYGKVVFDENITEQEIAYSARLAQKHDIELVLSPMMLGDKMSVTSSFLTSIYNKYLSYYERVRVIPQVHKFINVE